MTLYAICVHCGDIWIGQESDAAQPVCRCGFLQAGPPAPRIVTALQRPVPLGPRPPSLVPHTRPTTALATAPAIADPPEGPAEGPTSQAPRTGEALWRRARGLPVDGQEPIGRFRSQRYLDLVSGEDEADPPATSPVTTRSAILRSEEAHQALNWAPLQDRLIVVETIEDVIVPQLMSRFAPPESYGLISDLFPSQRVSRSRRYEGLSYTPHPIRANYRAPVFRRG